MTVSKRNIYLKTIPLSEAVQTAQAALNREALVAVESIPAEKARGRVLSEAVYARFSAPTYHSAAMDGIAVNARNTFQAREGNPLTLERGKDYDPINTGHPMPEGRDAVIMIENVVQVDENTVRIESAAFPWQHVRRIGEDMVATELLYPRHHRIRPYDVGILLSGGVWEVSVFERLRVHILPTGDEVLDYTKRPRPEAGQVVESNSQVLAAMLEELGCEAFRVPPVPDDPELLTQAIRQALDAKAHAVIVCAGSSAGSKDFTRQVLDGMGRVLVHGVAAMPGKPSLLAEVEGRLLVGAPGYPVSAVVCFEELVAPLLAWLGHFEAPRREKVKAMLTRSSPSKLGQEEFLRLGLGKVPGPEGEKYVATPLGRGAGNLTTMARAQALTRVPANSEGVEQGKIISAELLVPEESLDRLLVQVGSHDNILDILADELMALPEPLRLASSHAGSMGGITALKNHSAYFAGAHLLDPETGDFNFSFLEKYLPERDVLVVNLAIRHQGLMVAKGNPKNIQGVADLARDDVRFINRQRGSGTRILLDHSLKQAGVDPRSVDGYGKEEFTHMAVAVNVLTRAADCGLGIYAAAKALDLDFVPLARERYDLLIPRDLENDFKIQVLRDLLHSENLKKRIEARGGYETRLTGKIMRPGQGLGD